MANRLNHSMRPAITLTTDFGWRDPYVGAMKGVLLRHAPGSTLVDITHDIDPGDIQAAAYTIAAAAPYYPVGTVHLVVVDPGVGTSRRALAAGDGHGMFVAPDNGVLSLALTPEQPAQVVEIEMLDSKPADASPTFHGRDIFAPVAARLAMGAKLEEMGRPVSDWVRLSLPVAEAGADEIRGTVIYVDHFGNLITNIERGELAKFSDTKAIQIELDGKWIAEGLHRTFGDVESGEPLAYIGSTNRLEIAVRDSSAAVRFQAGVRSGISIRKARLP